MTIAKGRPWGVVAPRPVGAPRVAADAQLAARVAAGDRGPVELAGGDLWRTLGGATTGPTVQLLPVDVLRVEADGRPLVAAAHVVIKGRGRLGWWRGAIVAVMNVGAIGRWDVAPRAHPNDGRADVIEVAASMPARARLEAWRRLPTGTHVPHPDIRVRQPADVELSFERPVELHVDGVRHGVVQTVRVTVEPDACTVYA